jgi:hypothetical protein
VDAEDPVVAEKKTAAYVACLSALNKPKVHTNVTKKLIEFNVVSFQFLDINFIILHLFLPFMPANMTNNNQLVHRK